MYIYDINSWIMKSIALKLDEDIFAETEQLAKQLNESRNRYINKALNHFNRLQRDYILTQLLASESQMVSVESLKVLSELEKLDDHGTAV